MLTAISWRILITRPRTDSLTGSRPSKEYDAAPQAEHCLWNTHITRPHLPITTATRRSCSSTATAVIPVGAGWTGPSRFSQYANSERFRQGQSADAVVQAAEYRHQSAGKRQPREQRPMDGIRHRVPAATARPRPIMAAPLPSIQNNTLSRSAALCGPLSLEDIYTFSAYVRAGASGARIGLLKPGSMDPWSSAPPHRPITPAPGCR